MSKNFNHPLKFFPYIKNPMSFDNVKELYSYHEINPVKSDLYYDFIKFLSTKIFKTYFGDNVATTEINKQHFDWCWSTTIKTFSLIGLYPVEENKVYKYLFNFFDDMYYSTDTKEQNEGKINIVFEYIFNYHLVKSAKDVENFVSLYKLFDENFKTL